MDWNTALSAMAIIGFFVMMMRGCGSMAGGGCGMGHARRRDDAPQAPPRHQSEQRAR